MWATAQRLRGVPVFIMVMPWRLRGHLDHGRLEAALSDVTDRHAALRTSLTYDQGQLLQVIRPEASVPLERHRDLALGDGDGDAAMPVALERLRAHARRGLDLAKGPVFTAHLWTLAPRDHLLGLIVHHAFCDAWSAQILMRDLVECYRARLLGERAELGDLAMSFADFAREQFETHERGGYATELDYWRRQLAQPPAALAFPVMQGRERDRHFETALVTAHGDEVQLQALKSVSRAHGVSVFALLLAVVAATIHRRTGAEDLLLGVSTLNRWTPAARSFIGCASSLLPARLRPSAGVPRLTLAQQAHQTVRELLAYGRVPLELILRETQSALLGTGSVAMPVWAQLQEPAESLMLSAEGLMVEPMGIDRVAMNCNLEFDLLQTAQRLTSQLAYRVALCDHAFAQDLLADFEDQLGEFLRDPNGRVGAV